MLSCKRNNLQGDSGNPLTVNGTLAGIVSHGVHEAYELVTV